MNVACSSTGVYAGSSSGRISAPDASFTWAKGSVGEKVNYTPDSPTKTGAWWRAFRRKKTRNHEKRPSPHPFQFRRKPFSRYPEFKPPSTKSITPKIFQLPFNKINN